MGSTVQKRIARKLDLELLLSKLAPHLTPSPSLEQYTISPSTAATMLYFAAYTRNEIIGRRVLDMGCGTGRLALAAAFLGAKEVVGVDIDKKAIITARENAATARLAENTQWIIGDIDSIEARFDVVIQNPPFGVQKAGADRKFIAKALGCGKVVYSLHKSTNDNEQLRHRVKNKSDGMIQVSPSPFMSKFVEKNGGRIEAVYALLMTIPHMFSFHTQRKHEFAVDLYVLRSLVNDEKSPRSPACKG